MQRVERSLGINAPPDRVWRALTDPDCFQVWCGVFSPGSFFEGDWSVGSVMRFFGPMEDGSVMGQVGRVFAHEPGRLVRLEHFGVIEGGQDVFSGPSFDSWIPSVEEHRFDRGVYSVSMDVPDDAADWFGAKWEEALAEIKRMAEG